MKVLGAVDMMSKFKLFACFSLHMLQDLLHKVKTENWNNINHIRVKLLLLQEAILQKETMRKAGDWQQVEKNDKIRRWSDDGRSIGELKEDRKEVVDYSMRQSGKQAVDQSGYWSPQTGACPWQVGEKIF